MEMLRAHTAALERRSKSLRRHFLIRKVSFLRINIFIILINHLFPCPTITQLCRNMEHCPTLQGAGSSHPSLEVLQEMPGPTWPQRSPCHLSAAVQQPETTPWPSGAIGTEAQGICPCLMRGSWGNWGGSGWRRAGSGEIFLLSPSPWMEAVVRLGSASARM